MKILTISIIISVLVLGLITVGSNQAFGSALSCTATLDGNQEVPPSGSQATGTANLQLNPAMNRLTISIQIVGLDLDGNQSPGNDADDVAGAHIHAAPVGFNGGVVFGFISPDSDTNADLVINAGAGTIVSAWDTLEGQATTLPAELANLQNGDLYINIHTTAFPGGEIRGQIFCQPVMNGFIPDHYFSYVVNDKTVPEFDPFTIGLIDQFGEEEYRVVKPTRMYNPVQKNDEPIIDFETHLKAYKIRGDTPKVQNILLINQFEAIDVDIKRVDSLLVPTAKSHTGPTNPLTDEPVDHYKCYRVNVNERIENGPVSKNPVLVADPNFKEQRFLKVTGKPLLCNPVMKVDPMTGKPLSEIKNPEVHLACYNVKPLANDRGHTKIRFDTNNQFGPEDLITKRHDVVLQSGKVLKHEICVPTKKILENGLPY